MSAPKKPRTTGTFRTRVGAEGRVTVPFKVRTLMMLYAGEEVEVRIRKVGPRPAVAAPGPFTNTTDGNVAIEISHASSVSVTQTPMVQPPPLTQPVSTQPPAPIQIPGA